jgi:hypothetical protein
VNAGLGAVNCEPILVEFRAFCSFRRGDVFLVERLRKSVGDDGLAQLASAVAAQAVTKRVRPITTRSLFRAAPSAAEVLARF